MSVEDIQKVNEMAQTFLDQGVYSSREEAVKKAQEMLNKKIAGNDLQIKETEDKQNIAASGEDADKLRNMVERTKEYVERQFGGYKNALIALEKEIRALKQEVETLKSRPAAPVQQAPQQQAPSHQQEQPQQQAPAQEAPKQSNESNPRTGKSNPDDVSVEKMFYFGNK